jgi:hypothetical protein
MITLYIEDSHTGQTYINMMDFSSGKFPLPRIGEKISILIEAETDGKCKKTPHLFTVDDIIHHYLSNFDLYRFNIQILVSQVGKDYSGAEIKKQL